MPRVENWELDYELKMLRDLLDRTGARHFDPVSDILSAFIDSIKLARRGIEIAEQIWVIERSEDTAKTAAERITELLEWSL